ncbi:MAG: T9SS type A sorting domain-containing protein [Bacteroidetes bacterium]|nr:MAG: T9SS type A sorting domain-containing protein [Bacteroidota bacterium]
MKAYTFLLLVIIGCFIMVSKSYSAKDTLPPDPSWYESCDGSVEGFIEDLPRTYERSKLKSIILDSSKSNNYILSYEEFIPGKKFLLEWYLKVNDADSNAHAIITFSDMEGNDTTIIIEYVTSKLKIRPNLDFGRLYVGQEKEMECWLVNEANFADTIVEINLKNNNRGFEIFTDLFLPILLAPHDSTKIKIKFKATDEGIFYDSVGVKSVCGCLIKFLTQVKATVKTSKIEVNSCNFGDEEINNLKSGIISVMNKSDVELVITDYKPPQNQSVFIIDFDIVTNLPLKLNAWESFNIPVNFFPTEEKEYRDSIVFISNTIKEGIVDSVAELFGKGISYPIIDVSDAYFGDVIQSKPVQKIVTVTNKGMKDLIITDYYKPDNAKFVHKFDREINLDNPLILIPQESWSFEVEFCPPNEAGCFFTNYIIFHSNAVKGDSTAYFRVDSVLLGIREDEININNIEITPNPADEFLSFNFNVETQKPDFIKLFDSFGNVVYENKNIIENNIKINTSELASGMYFLVIGHRSVRKVVVMH